MIPDNSTDTIWLVKNHLAVSKVFKNKYIFTPYGLIRFNMTYMLKYSVGSLLQHETISDLDFSYSCLVACESGTHVRKRHIRRLMEIANTKHTVGQLKYNKINTHNYKYHVMNIEYKFFKKRTSIKNNYVLHFGKKSELFILSSYLIYFYVILIWVYSLFVKSSSLINISRLWNSVHI